MTPGSAAAQSSGGAPPPSRCHGPTASLVTLDLNDVTLGCLKRPFTRVPARRRRQPETGRREARPARWQRMTVCRHEQPLCFEKLELEHPVLPQDDHLRSMRFVVARLRGRTRLWCCARWRRHDGGLHLSRTASKRFARGGPDSHGALRRCSVVQPHGSLVVSLHGDSAIVASRPQCQGRVGRPRPRFSIAYAGQDGPAPREPISGQVAGEYATTGHSAVL